MGVWEHIGSGLMVVVVGCGCAPALSPAVTPIVVRSTETLPVKPAPKTSSPESATVSDASLFADDPESRRRKRRKRRRKRKGPATSLVGSSASAKSEESVALRHRVSTGAREAVADETLKVINQNSQAISHCVADASRRGERATGKMEVEVAIDARGQVRSTRLLSEDYVRTILGTCVLRRIKEWRFTATGEPTRVVLPFVVEAAY